MAKKKAKNPFYIVLVLAGSAFGLTALGYFVMAAMANYDPARSMRSIEAQHGLIPFMDRHGKTLLVVELGLLAVATVLAIVTDGFWTRKVESENATNDVRDAGEQGEDDESKPLSDD